MKKPADVNTLLDKFEKFVREELILGPTGEGGVGLVVVQGGQQEAGDLRTDRRVDLADGAVQADHRLEGGPLQEVLCADGGQGAQHHGLVVRRGHGKF